MCVLPSDHSGRGPHRNLMPWRHRKTPWEVSPAAPWWSPEPGPASPRPPRLGRADRAGDGTRRYAVAAAVADVFLDDDGPELGADHRCGRAGVETPGVRAVPADAAKQRPAQRPGVELP